LQNNEIKRWELRELAEDDSKIDIIENNIYIPREVELEQEIDPARATGVLYIIRRGKWLERNLQHFC